MARQPRNSGGGGVSAFAHDPQESCGKQVIFWAPEVLPTVVPVAATTSRLKGDTPQPLLDLAAGRVRRASDGWHAILRVGGVEHRVWLKEPPAIGTNYVAELPFDSDFDARAYAARRLWRAINGRPPGPAFHQLSKQRRERLSAAIRALDARGAGSTYRAIAEVYFGKKRIPYRAWKTHDLRNRTIRLVQGGLALMRGGYRDLLRPKRRDK
ncbi:DUF2285 domain-containing protein [Bradyrhizobium sp. KBS0727]|uniref:DUF2285 domain-containing protein n=1 Tax=unclassified Bradyrhizobium TaxID=2631580 RepID=UPI00110D72E4|nr:MULTISPECIES: DUF2285 domain-containing protein [unclassified Bradyrhizobium]QDW39853.1 DUF2285 domain-containing protein [Bradyrhizobium sp. KBS0725]QDW46456.1 DUF2285 domain-containing protein [Bradyrhizobium sp. KBS0727]